MGNGKIALIKGLEEIGTVSCLNLVKSLELISTEPISFHLRNSNLIPEDTAILSRSFEALQDHKDVIISSISLSFNPQIGDYGISQLLKSFPCGLRELGLVECELTDVAGQDLLLWLHSNKQLRLLCIEGNHFSKKLTQNFHAYAEQCKDLYLEI